MSASETEFDQRSYECEQRWSEGFLNYYNSNLRESVRRSSRFELEPLGLFTYPSGVTNNPCEGCNSDFKDYIRLQYPSLKPPTDVLALMLYNYAQKQAAQCALGLSGQGDCIPKSDIKRGSVKSITLPQPIDFPRLVSTLRPDASTEDRKRKNAAANFLSKRACFDVLSEAMLGDGDEEVRVI